MACHELVEAVLRQVEDGVEQDDAAREAGVVRRGVGGEGAAQRVSDDEVPAGAQVGDEVGEPVAVGARAGTVAAEVGRGDVRPAFRQPFRDLPPRRAGRLDAVQQQDPRPSCGAPAVLVQFHGIDGTDLYYQRG